MIIKVGKEQLNAAAQFPPPISNDKERLIATLQDELRYTPIAIDYHDQALEDIGMINEHSYIY